MLVFDVQADCAYPGLHIELQKHVVGVMEGSAEVGAKVDGWHRIDLALPLLVLRPRIGAARVSIR